MLIDERSRHDLYLKLEELLGKPEADTLMAHLPPTTFAELAARRDLDHLADRLRLESADLRTELKTEMADLRTELRTGLADVRTVLERTQSTTIRVVVATQLAGVISTAGLVLGVAQLV